MPLVDPVNRYHITIPEKREFMDKKLFIKMYPNFTPEEFQCPCRGVKCKKHGMEYFFLAALQDIRLQCGFRFVINSGYRCKEYNSTLIGSAPDSYHIQGLACDISLIGLTPKEKHRLIKKAMERFNGVGIHPDFIHIDLRRMRLRSLWIGAQINPKALLDNCV